MGALLSGCEGKIRLVEQEEARIGDLAAAAGVTPPTASRILDALERRDLVRRARSAHDRRAVAVSLTPAGRTVLRDQEGWMRARQESFYMGLPREEQALAPDLLRRMAALIDDLAAGPEAAPVARRLRSAPTPRPQRATR
jgi:DNA-binding MarR family transcriptional regulator